MTYAEALGRLLALERFGVRPGLEATRAALAAVGDPQKGLRALHLAGTNGKGSTAAFADSLLRAGGVKSGLYTSPHLSRFTERIRIDGAELDEEETARLAERVLALSLPAGEPLTFFEVVTVMAFLALAAHSVGAAVLEAGLGGRLDATNVLDSPLATVVTGVALDHTEVLGSTPAQIAVEKAGIFKPGAPAIFAATDEAAARVLDSRARELGAPALRLGRDFDGELTAAGFSYRGPGGPLDGAALGLRGPHQAANAALALAAVAHLAPLTDEQRRRGLAETRWPGRLETLDDRTGLLGGAPVEVIADAAHNPDGARSLARALPPLQRGRPVTLVFGVVRDKDAAAMLAPLLPLAAACVLTRPDSARARDPESLRPLAPGAAVADSLGEALALAASAGGGERVVLVAGSIFLVAEARRLLLGERADPVRAQDPPAGPREKL